MEKKVEELAEETKKIFKTRMELAKKAEEKMKNGEKLTFEEFMAILSFKKD